MVGFDVCVCVCVAHALRKEPDFPFDYAWMLWDNFNTPQYGV